MWFGASTFYNCTKFNYEVASDYSSVKVFFEYTLPVIPATTVDIVFTVRAPGIIRLIIIIMEKQDYQNYH